MKQTKAPRESVVAPALEILTAHPMQSDLFDLLPVAVYTCDKEGKITYYNKMAVQLWGYEPEINDEALRFCACHKRFDMDDTYVPADDTPMARALKTGQSFRNVETKMERPDGS